jgi:hypothetical protein
MWVIEWPGGWFRVCASLDEALAIHAAIENDWQRGRAEVWEIT